MRRPFTRTIFFFTKFIKPYPGYIIFFTNMSGWSSAPRATPSVGSSPSDAWLKRKYKHPNIKAPERAVIFTKRTAATFLEEVH